MAIKAIKGLGKAFKKYKEKSTALLLAIAPFFLKSAFAIKFLITDVAISNNSFYVDRLFRRYNLQGVRSDLPV